MGDTQRQQRNKKQGKEDRKKLWRENIYELV